MKHYWRPFLLVILALQIVSIDCFCQFSYGVKAGANINDIATRYLSSFEDYHQVSIGFHAGLFGRITLNEKFSISPELQFTQRGAYSGKDAPGATRINLNYLELPVFISCDVLKELRIDLGPSISYMLWATRNGERSKSDEDYKVDFGISVGIQFHMTSRMSFIGRYYYGLCKIDESGDDLSNETSTDYNRTVQLGFGYKLN